ncbi:mannose-1-phosphate guanyltransferase alpha-A [Nephila pilipes]|uniref:Mannose-1-phosphate guanyltransferase alpha-A n=1 Tax=Nephila pilipes TaxID=299642 RepID=A0A8X6PF46_NEPPI|nr:mannose-1-phosphate guanyltransferase alpha-A [Nephila pilipes]
MDEQLSAFRGRYRFRMYITNKPTEYGINIVMMFNVGRNYKVNKIQYLDSLTKTKGISLVSYFVEELTKRIQGTNRNIRIDDWFTSLPLSEKLLMQANELNNCRNS